VAVAQGAQHWGNINSNNERNKEPIKRLTM